MPTFIWLSVSVSTAAADTSEPVPAVVGTQIKRHDRPGNLVVADVSLWRAAVRQQGRGDLGQSMLLPPPRPMMPSGSKRRASSRQTRPRMDGSGSPPVKAPTMRLLRKGVPDALEDARALENGIGDDEDAAQRQPAGDVADLLNGIRAEDDLAAE